MSWWLAPVPVMASTEFVDPYLDPETGLLRNRVGARTKAALDEAEAELPFARLMQLMDHPPKATCDLDAMSNVIGEVRVITRSGVLRLLIERAPG